MVLTPAVRYQSCGFEQPFTARIATLAGALPAGVQDDPDTCTTFGFFAPNRLPPVVRFVWIGHCTRAAEPLVLTVSTAGAAASYPLGTSETCASHGLSGSSLQAAAQPTGQGPPVSVTGLAPAAGGYGLVDTVGRVTAYGGAPSLGGAPPTQSAVVAVVAAPDAGFFGSLPGQDVRHLGGPISGMAPTPDGHGYRLVGARRGHITGRADRPACVTGGARL